MYQPEVHRACSREEVEQISKDLKLDCSPAMIDVFTNRLTGSLKILTAIDAIPDFVPVVKYPRTPGHKPEPKDSCGNAWAWRCDIQGSSSGKLSGKTFAIKDNCAVAVVPMSNGSLMLEGYTPEYDATVVTRILDAGGRILGKASCDDLCLSAMGFSSPSGYIHFPDKPDRSVGGSSGGSGVLVALREVDMAIGGDQGGSIRIPSTYTGIVGLKPTHGLVPYTGAQPIEPCADHLGPMARTVTDCALLLEVIAGSDGLDGRQVMGTMEIPEYNKLLEGANISGKKIGILTEGFELCDRETRSFVEEFLRGHTQPIGVKASPVSVPLHKEGLTILLGFIAHGALTGLEQGAATQGMKGFNSTSLEKAVRQGFESSANVLSPGGQGFLMLGGLIKRRYGNHYYTKARNLAIKLSQAYDEALKEFDILVMPTLTHTARTFVHLGESKVSVQHNAYLEESVDMIANTAAFNVSGHPALSLPLGPMGDGSVPALMLVGRKWDELTVLQVARAFERTIPARDGL